MHAQNTAGGECKPSVEHQRRLNPVMKEVVRKEVLKWLNTGFIYAISDSPWVSPVQYTCLTDLILVFRSTYLYFGSYTCITEHMLVFRILYLYYGYGSTRRYYRDFICTKVPVGTRD